MALNAADAHAWFAILERPLTLAMSPHKTMDIGSSAKRPSNHGAIHLQPFP
jgi:hypothetical protein